MNVEQINVVRLKLLETVCYGEEHALLVIALVIDLVAARSTRGHGNTDKGAQQTLSFTVGSMFL